MSQSLRAEFRPEALGFHYPDPDAFVRSQWRWRHALYLTWRAFWLLWHVTLTVACAVNFWDNIADSTDGGSKWFIFYPHLTFLVTVVACACDLVGATRAGPIPSQAYSSDNKVIEGGSIRNSDKDEILFRGEFTLVHGLKEAPTPRLSQVTWFLYSVINSSNILATACFWAVTYDSHTYAVDVVAHLANSVFVVSNLMVTGLPVRLLHFVYPVLYTGLYLAFTGIYHASGGTDVHGRDSIYRPLDWDNALPAALTVVIGLLVVVPLLHGVTFAAYTFRVYLHGRLNSESYAPSEEYETRVAGVVYKSGGKAEATAHVQKNPSKSLDVPSNAATRKEQSSASIVKDGSDRDHSSTPAII